MSSELNFHRGNVVYPISSGHKFIAHICNNHGVWGGGIVTAISEKWPQPEAAYRSWYKETVLALSKFRWESGPFGLGEIQVVDVEDDVSVINMIAQRGYVSEHYKVAVDYPSLGECLYRIPTILRRTEGSSLHMPRIGCGLAGGTWDVIGPLVETYLKGFQVHVYDF